MTFTVQSALRHDGTLYQPGDTFDKMTEEEARAAGLVPRVLKPTHPAQAKGSGGGKSSSKEDGSKKEGEEK